MDRFNPVDLCIAFGTAFATLYAAYCAYRMMTRLCVLVVKLFVAAVIVSALYKYAWKQASTMVWEADLDSGGHLNRWFEESTLLRTLNATVRPLYDSYYYASFALPDLGAGADDDTLAADVQAASAGLDETAAHWFAFGRSARDFIVGLL